jgi:15-cis-phytoene desaturase
MDVVIVGGGLAGLTTAVGLIGTGLSVAVFEQDDILGGRARSWIDKTTGDSVTVGPHIFLSEYPNMLQLLRILKTENCIVWQRGKFIDIAKGEKIYKINMAPLPPPFNFLPSIIREREFFPIRDILSNRRAAWFCMGLSEQDVLRLDRVDALSVLKKLGVTDNFINRFWRFVCMSIMNVPLEKCSAGALFRFFKLMVSHMQYDVGFADRGLGELFAPQAQALIEKSGGKVFTRRAVEKISRNSSGLEVKLADGSAIHAKYVVAALPPTALKHIVPENWKAAKSPFKDLEFFEPSPYISTYLWFDKKLTRRQFWAREFDEKDLNCDFYDYSNIYSHRTSPHSLITTNCIYCQRASSMTDKQVVQTTLAELAQFLPEAKRAKLVHSLVVRIPMAIHCPHPGTERRRPPVVTPVENLFVAGDWCRTQVPASMESACCAGWQTAEAIREKEGKPKKMARKGKPGQGIARAVERVTPAMRGLPLFPDPRIFIP